VNELPTIRRKNKVRLTILVFKPKIRKHNSRIIPTSKILKKTSGGKESKNDVMVKGNGL
jgi:hypothetical protein